MIFYKNKNGYLKGEMAKTQMQKVKAIIMEVSSNQTQMESQDKYPTATVPAPRCATLASFLTVRLNPWQEVR